jgi:hypothetical protein
LLLFSAALLSAAGALLDSDAAGLESPDEDGFVSLAALVDAGAAGETSAAGGKPESVFGEPSLFLLP